MSDPSEQASARIRAAADQFGAAIGDAFDLTLRKATVARIAEKFGPGPWVLYEDGRVEPHRDDAHNEPVKKDQTEDE